MPERKSQNTKAITALLFVLCLAIYLSNGKSYPASDTVAARYLPFSIIREGDFDLDEFKNLQARSLQSGVVFTGTHYVSAYPVGSALLALPIFIPSAIGSTPGNSTTARKLEKTAAAIIVALSAAVLFITLLLITDGNWALLITLIYALGTSSFSVSSQALWQHGASQLSCAAALYCLIRGMKQTLWMAISGLPISFAVFCRPTNALLLAPAILFVLIHYRKSFPLFVLASLPPILFQLIYNHFYFGNAFRTQWPIADQKLWSTPLLEGAAGILFSPARGLLIYSPVLLFSVIAAASFWRKKYKNEPEPLATDSSGKIIVLFRYLCAGVLLTVLLYSKFFMWWGGYTYGPRLLVDLTPILCLFLAAIPPMKLPVKIVFSILAAWSVMAHAVGAYSPDLRWNADVQIDANPKAAWMWTNNQLVNPIQRAYGRVIGKQGSPGKNGSPEE